MGEKNQDDKGSRKTIDNIVVDVYTNFTSSNFKMKVDIKVELYHMLFYIY